MQSPLRARRCVYTHLPCRAPWSSSSCALSGPTACVWSTLQSAGLSAAYLSRGIYSGSLSLSLVACVAVCVAAVLRGLALCFLSLVAPVCLSQLPATDPTSPWQPYGCGGVALCPCLFVALVAVPTTDFCNCRRVTDCPDCTGSCIRALSGCLPTLLGVLCSHLCSPLLAVTSAVRPMYVSVLTVSAEIRVRLSHFPTHTPAEAHTANDRHCCAPRAGGLRR